MKGRHAPIAIVIMAIALSSAAHARPRTISFPTVGGPEEAKFILEDKSRVVIDGGRQFRNVDGDRGIVYRFDIAGARSLSLRVVVGNNYLFSASTDGTTWQEILRSGEPAQGLSNLATQDLDLSRFAGAEQLLIRFEHSRPAEMNGGYGGCLFEMALTMEDDNDVAVATIAPAEPPPTVDGLVDDRCWQSAQPLATFSDRFMDRQPVEPTTVMLVYDETNLYLAARLIDPTIQGAAASTTSRDGTTYADDCVELFLQAPGSPNYFHIAVNHAGAIFDERNAEGAASWDCAAKAATDKWTMGWTVELAVPLRDLGVEAIQPGDEWRAGIFRVQMSNAQFLAWSSVEGGGWHSPDRFGKLVFVGPTRNPLPSVNLKFVEPPTFGKSVCRAAFTAMAYGTTYRLKWALYPLNGNPTTEDLGFRIENERDLEFPVGFFGPAHLVASVIDPVSGAVVSRAVLSFTVRKEDVVPMEVTLRQPFYSTETEAPAQIAINIPPDKLSGAKLVATFGRGKRTRETVEASDTELRTGNVRIAFKTIDAARPGDCTATYELLSSEGKRLAYETREIHKLSEDVHPSVVTIDKRLVTHVNGKPFLPLGFMLATPEKAMADAGYNVALFGLDYDSSSDTLDECERNGIMALPHVCQYLRGTNNWDGLRAVVSRFKDHPALLGWYAADEPEGYGDTPEILKKAYDIIKEIDPNHPVLVLTNAPSMFAHYRQVADVVMADPYPIPNDPLTTVSDWTNAARKGIEDSKPVWMTPQGFGWQEIGAGDGRPPTDDEFRNMSYACLIHGAKGLIWWPYSVPRQNHWDCFTRLAAEHNALREVILFGEPVEGMAPDVVVDGAIHYRAWGLGKTVYIVAANLSYETARYTFSLPSRVPKRAAVEAMFEGRRLAVEGGTLADEFGPAAVHVYRLETR